MSRSMQYKAILGAAGMGCLFLFPNSAHAQVVTPTVTTLAGGIYHYDYSIMNTGTTDLFDVSIHVHPGANQVFSVMAPIGFTASYDSGLGLVDFLENTNSFATGQAISGFTYDSSLAPKSSTFDANFAPTSGGITTTSGSTLAATVPEGSSLPLLCSGLGALGVLVFKSKRRREVR